MQYVKERETFGRPIAKFEGVQFPIAEAHTMIEAANTQLSLPLAQRRGPAAYQRGGHA